MPSPLSQAAYGFTGAHEHRNWANENFRKVALNAILWIAKVPVPTNGVESEITPDDIMQNLDPKQKPKPKEAPATARTAIIFRMEISLGCDRP